MRSTGVATPSHRDRHFTFAGAGARCISILRDDGGRRTIVWGRHRLPIGSGARTRYCLRCWYVVIGSSGIDRRHRHSIDAGRIHRTSTVGIAAQRILDGRRERDAKGVLPYLRATAPTVRTRRVDAVAMVFAIVIAVPRIVVVRMMDSVDECRPRGRSLDISRSHATSKRKHV